MKALRAFDSLRGAEFKPWFLAIVRNTSFTWLSRKRGMAGFTAEQSLESAAEVQAEGEIYDPQAIAIRGADAELVRRAIGELPEAWREVLTLREMEGLSYKEIGRIIGAPIGTVMSRLARARGRLQHLLIALDEEGAS